MAIRITNRLESSTELLASDNFYIGLRRTGGAGDLHETYATRGRGTGEIFRTSTRTSEIGNFSSVRLAICSATVSINMNSRLAQTSATVWATRS
jgi:hypothetical protein